MCIRSTTIKYRENVRRYDFYLYYSGPYYFINASVYYIAYSEDIIISVIL